MLRAGRAPVACRAPLSGASYATRRGADAAAAPTVTPAPLRLLGLCRAPRRRSLAAAAAPLSMRAPRSGVPACARSSGERAAEVRPARRFACRCASSKAAVSQASQPGKQRAAPGRAVCQPVAALQPGRRGTALAATAGEAGENKAERQGTFFNRQVELQSLAALLGEPPTGVLVMTGPPSCGKSGMRALWFVISLRVVLILRAMQRCSSN